MNGDGTDDLITGHYWPGDIFVYWGEEDGGFAPRENLKDETGRNLNAGEPWESEDEPNMQSLAAAPYATDFDRDGDYDMLIGNIRGQIVLMENVGSASEPKFSTERRFLKADGETIEVPQGDAGPVFEDWDGDGKRDLVSGAGDGSVWLYRNVGEGGAPAFAEGRVLVEAPEAAWDPYPHGEDPPGPGVRSKVCVTDYDGDGLVDLLLGGFQSERGVEPELDEEQIARRDELRAEMDEAQKRYGELATQEEPDEDELSKLSERMSELYDELGPLERRDIQHGFVWLYRRLPEAEASGTK